jgi:hypothetical protein
MLSNVVTLVSDHAYTVSPHAPEAVGVQAPLSMRGYGARFDIEDVGRIIRNRTEAPPPAGLRHRSVAARGVGLSRARVPWSVARTQASVPTDSLRVQARDHEPSLRTPLTARVSPRFRRCPPHSAGLRRGDLEFWWDCAADCTIPPKPEIKKSRRHPNEPHLAGLSGHRLLCTQWSNPSQSGAALGSPCAEASGGPGRRDRIQ